MLVPPELYIDCRYQDDKHFLQGFLNAIPNLQNGSIVQPCICNSRRSRIPSAIGLLPRECIDSLSRLLIDFVNLNGCNKKKSIWLITISSCPWYKSKDHN